MKNENIICNINAIRNVDLEDINDDIICAFEDYEYEGVSEIIVSTPDDSNPNHLNAYANHKDAPIFSIDLVENEDGTYSATSVC
jgi:hypothetical protein